MLLFFSLESQEMMKGYDYSGSTIEDRHFFKTAFFASN
jgi:hypothetical protein